MSGNKDINYKALRLIVGSIAISIAIVTTIMFGLHNSKFMIPTSISVTYHLGARDFFVGSLFAVGSFLIAYNGFSKTEKVLAKIAGILAIFVAVFPTTLNLNWIDSAKIPFDTQYCKNLHSDDGFIRTLEDKSICNTTGSKVTPYIHYTSAVLLITILFYYCLGFANRANDKLKKHPNLHRIRIRFWIYKLCAGAMVLSGIYLILSKWLDNSPDNTAVFWVEFVCLWAFGISWLVASKRLPLISYKENEEDAADKELEEEQELKEMAEVKIKKEKSSF
ncbi:hypothetical protein [Rheinheimera sp.]|uniref:hypothetical protein n=1 Tax=Rheinheimera sp. TaxID=1869214 RepID=UPI002732F93B|nr:hypothetical protein [Rheinheimera sp.]MDP2716437.1 hypothetical protein [Rheinheimera sp.]